MMEGAYSFPIDTNEIEDIIYNQQLQVPDYQHHQQGINDPATFHFDEQQVQGLDTTMTDQLFDSANELSDQQQKETEMDTSSDTTEYSPSATQEEIPPESTSIPSAPSSIDSETLSNPAETFKEEAPQPIKQAAIRDPPIKQTDMPMTVIQPSSLPIKLAAAAINPSASSATTATTSNRPALASVGPPRQQEKPPMGQHSEPNIPPGIPQQQHPAQPPASKPSVPPGSDLGTLGRIGVFGEDSFAIHNSAIPFMQIWFLCFFSIWFVFSVKRS